MRSSERDADALTVRSPYIDVWSARQHGNELDSPEVLGHIFAENVAPVTTIVQANYIMIT